MKDILYKLTIAVCMSLTLNIKCAEKKGNT